MKYLIYPKGYDPVVASGPVTQDYLRMGIVWSPEETEKMQALEAKALLSPSPPEIGHYYSVISD